MLESVIKREVDLIAECIYAKVQKSEMEEKEYLGIYSGSFGILLFLLYYLRYSQSEKYALLTEEYAEKLLAQFVEREKLHTFCSGFSGILYLFEFLRENRIMDMDVSEIHPLLDDFIISRMRRDMQQRNYDFMHGALGVGLYFLKRGIHSECIQELVDYLYHTAEKDTDGLTFKWESIIDPEENLIGYNLALSHGISSIIIFLSRVIKSGGVHDKKIVEMLSGAVNYVLLQQKNPIQFGSCFPNYIITNSSKPVSRSRLAWCYGDLGTGMALRQAGKAIGKTEWEEKGLEILLQSTKRRSYNEHLVMDAGICHGSAGIALIFRRMFLETRRDEFREATRYWLNQTLDFSRFQDGLAGYKTFLKERWECDYSLLTGIAGIGLVLISNLKDEDQQDWDELFLLS